MRTYKTWEAIKMLSENPKLRFKTTIKEHTLVGEREAEVIIIRRPSRIMFLIPRHNQEEEYAAPPYPLNIWDDEWLLTETPVTWQEAFQALIDGGHVKCECKGCYIGRDYCIFPDTAKDICMTALQNGQWFIVPEGVDE